VSLNIKITKLTFITQNNHVYEYTAEGLTPEMLLNVRSPYRRQKRDLSIIRLSFRRPHTGIEIFTINIITFLPITSTISYFLPFCDHTDYFLFFYLLAIDYFLPSCDHIDYFFFSYLLTAISITYYRHIYR
jgi:hypothetical protein